MKKSDVFRSFSKNDFAISALQDILQSEESSLDNPFQNAGVMPEFFQTLNESKPQVQQRMSKLISDLNQQGYNEAMVDEYLLFFLHELIRVYRADIRRVGEVAAIKPGTRTELYKRLCIAKDVLHASYADNPDLNSLSREACMSVPQLIRQFKSVFGLSPHQYLMQIRLVRAAELLKETDLTATEIAGLCGFENNGTFGRAFKMAYRIQPIQFRKAGYEN